MKFKKFFTPLIVSSLILTACSSNTDINREEQPNIEQMENNIGNRGNGGNGGAITDYKLQDEELQTMLSEVIDKFELLTYTSPETGETLDYYLSIPENYDESQKYPLLMFIPDASNVGEGKESEIIITQGYGAGVWVTDEAQAKNPAIVMVPVFKSVAVNDNFEVSNEPELTVEVINYLSDNYSVDTSRIYTTGQSMGCMTSFHLNLKYPDLFAASLFVGGQWDTNIMLPLKNQKFFYIVAAGDPKASKGQSELMELFSQNGVEYSVGEWDAKLPTDEQDDNVNKMLSEGNDINFVTFTLNSTYPEGIEQKSPAGEHMTSFDFAYRIPAVRDWLFSQTK